MKRCRTRFILMIAVLAALPAVAQKKGNQRSAYIGYVYPAGGQVGSTFPVRIGGQQIDAALGVTVSGEGVHATIKESFRKIGSQEQALLQEQFKLLRKTKAPLSEEEETIKRRLQWRIGEYERKPANASIATFVLLDVQIDKDAQPGLREIRIITPRGLSNPLSFYVGKLPEHSRPAMKISKVQTLGKEQLSLRKRPPEEEEASISLPCTVNGQVGSGEINRYRFNAQKGDRLVINTLARQLVPYIADAVPGWFQPVISLQNADGKEVAFNDDFRFKPDPTLLFEVPADGEYVLSIYDSIYRGREDFVYRMTIGETPFVTGIFPLGAPLGKKVKPRINGWNLNATELLLPDTHTEKGIYLVAADHRDALSNLIPFAIDDLPETTEKSADVQKVNLPVIINGRIEQPGEEDVFEFRGRAGETVVAEINARRLDSPLDSFIRLTKADGTLLAFNDDHADPGSGLNTHHADSYLRVTLPKDGIYRLHLTDTARTGGPDYAYRLRLSPPQPDFALRTVPSHILLNPGKGGSTVEVHIIRKDGFDGPVELSTDTAGFNARPTVLPAGENKVKMNIAYLQLRERGTIPLTIKGTAEIDGETVSHDAVPSEDWMQAFLWRHLVPAQELLAYLREPGKQDDGLRPLPEEPDVSDFTSRNPKNLSKAKKQIAGRVRKICQLYQDEYLTTDLYKKTISGLLDFKEPAPAGQTAQR